MTKDNSLVLTNICYGTDEVKSVISIDENTIALCVDDGIEVYNKDTQL